jgi:hypothetical protein
MNSNLKKLGILFEHLTFCSLINTGLQPGGRVANKAEPF